MLNHHSMYYSHIASEEESEGSTFGFLATGPLTSVYIIVKLTKVEGSGWVVLTRDGYQVKHLVVVGGSLETY